MQLGGGFLRLLVGIGVGDDPAAGPHARRIPLHAGTTDGDHPLAVAAGITPADRAGIELAGFLHRLDDPHRLVGGGATDRRGWVQHQGQIKGGVFRVSQGANDRGSQVNHLGGLVNEGLGGDIELRTQWLQDPVVVLHHKSVLDEVLLAGTQLFGGRIVALCNARARR